VLALDGEILARGPGGERRIAAADFFVSHYTTTLADDELLLAVSLPREPVDAWGFHEITRRHGDFALAGAAAAFRLDAAGQVSQARVVLFAVDERPVRATAAEEALLGRRLYDAAAIADAARLAAAGVEPVPSIHGDTAFRQRLTAVAVRRALEQATTERTTG
jgi:carbon-monoxide dehydrogenase medium subunit